MALDLGWEMVTYRAALPDLLDREGQWVVIRQSEVAGTWPSYGEALAQGYKRYGLGPFLVKQIFAVEPVHGAPWAPTARDFQAAIIPPTPQYLIRMTCPEGVVYPNSVEGEPPVNHPDQARKFACVGDAMDWAAARPGLLDGYETAVEPFEV